MHAIRWRQSSAWIVRQFLSLQQCMQSVGVNQALGSSTSSSHCWTCVVLSPSPRTARCELGVLHHLNHAMSEDACSCVTVSTSRVDYVRTGGASNEGKKQTWSNILSRWRRRRHLGRQCGPGPWPLCPRPVQGLDRARLGDSSRLSLCSSLVIAVASVTQLEGLH